MYAICEAQALQCFSALLFCKSIARISLFRNNLEHFEEAMAFAYKEAILYGNKFFDDQYLLHYLFSINQTWQLHCLALVDGSDRMNSHRDSNQRSYCSPYENSNKHKQLHSMLGEANLLKQQRTSYLLFFLLFKSMLRTAGKMQSTDTRLKTVTMAAWAKAQREAPTNSQTVKKGTWHCL